MVLKLGEIGKLMGNEEIAVKCSRTNSRGGFAHHAEAVVNGLNVKAAVHYCNRTWEAYPFQTVLKALCEKIAVMVYGVPSTSALWNTKKWGNAREYAYFLMAQV